MRGLLFALALIVAVPALAEGEKQPSTQGQEDSDTPQSADKKHEKLSRSADSIKVSALPNDQGPKAASGEKGQEAQSHSSDPNWIAAQAARDSADYAFWMNLISLAGLIVGGLTMIAAGAAAYFAWLAAREARRSANAASASQEAFVAAEDANLVIEFPNGTKGESFEHGKLIRTTYDLNVLISNIGRSAARIEGWRFGDKTHRQEHTLKAGESWGRIHPIPVEVAPGQDFNVSILYSSPIRQQMALDVTARLIVREEGNGLLRIRAKARRAVVRKAS